jgi:hypothetical protein
MRIIAPVPNPSPSDALLETLMGLSFLIRGTVNLGSQQRDDRYDGFTPPERGLPADQIRGRMNSHPVIIRLETCTLLARLRINAL